MALPHAQPLDVISVRPLGAALTGVRRRREARTN